MSYRVGQKVWTCYHPYHETSDSEDNIEEIDKKYWKEATLIDVRADGCARMVQFEDETTWYVENHNITPKHSPTLRGRITEQLMAGEI
jgi:hypothetical protein